VVVEPIGFNRDIALALIPAMAAREVAGQLAGDAYASVPRRRGGPGPALGDRLKANGAADRAGVPRLVRLRAAMHLDDCVTRRETNGWKWPVFMVGYLFGSPMPLLVSLIGQPSPSDYS
jgi:ferrous iron transport protein B